MIRQALPLFVLLLALLLLSSSTTAARTSLLQRLKRLTQDRQEEEEPRYAWMTPAAADYNKEEDDAYVPVDIPLMVLDAMGDKARQEFEGLGAENAMLRYVVWEMVGGWVGRHTCPSSRLLLIHPPFPAGR